MMCFIGGFSIGLIVGIFVCSLILERSFIRLLNDSINQGSIKIKGIYYTIIKKDDI